ncbi:hypothetical protein K9N68_28760 [Kovacikia minuta CCNUW1]|uniref:hypothetical protein n=1 Tax=Kovacikia minuta TaxID=2931930 RepID=UPI001CCAB9F4|nr:hypothetical protein [Kovacikia minuta]UBF25526.1 hypothetical protein K9N68_28760 [Kovacikia minuta CCNUW1]
MKPINSGSRSPVTIGQIINRIRSTGKITRADEKFFLRALVTETSLSDREMDMVSDVLNRMQMGLIRVAD